MLFLCFPEVSHPFQTKKNKKKHLMTFLFGENMSLRLLRDLRENLEKNKIFTVLFKPHIKKSYVIFSLSRSKFQ